VTKYQQPIFIFSLDIKFIPFRNELPTSLSNWHIFNES